MKLNSSSDQADYCTKQRSTDHLYQVNWATQDKCRTHSHNCNSSQNMRWYITERYTTLCTAQGTIVFQRSVLERNDIKRFWRMGALYNIEETTAKPKLLTSHLQFIYIPRSLAIVEKFFIIIDYGITWKWQVISTLFPTNIFTWTPGLKLNLAITSATTI